jgi:hypothetical protein
MLDTILIIIQRSFRDTFNVIKGFFAILSYAITKDQISLGLSHFSTTFQVVKPGHYCTYEIGIYNITEKNEWVRMLFNIYLKENHVHSEGHYAYFEKTIYVKANESQQVNIIYDWKDNVVIGIDEVSFDPDFFWSGKCVSMGKYVVKTLLFDEKGEVLDELELIQKLSNENC